MRELIRLINKLIHLHIDLLSGLERSTQLKGDEKALRLAPRSARTKEQLFLLQSCFCGAQYSPHSLKQRTGREGNTSCLLRKFIFRKQFQTSHRDGPACSVLKQWTLSSQRPREVVIIEAAEFTLAIHEFQQSVAYRLLTNTRAESNELTDAITKQSGDEMSKQDNR